MPYRQRGQKAVRHGHHSSGAKKYTLQILSSSFFVDNSLRFWRTVIEFDSTVSLNEGSVSFYPKGCVSVAVFYAGCGGHTMEGKRLSGGRKKSNIDLLVKLRHETHPLIAFIRSSGFECFAGGASKNDGENDRK